MLRIFTDTAANIPPHLLEQYHITAMPLTYLLDGQPTVVRWATTTTRPCGRAPRSRPHW